MEMKEEMEVGIPRVSVAWEAPVTQRVPPCPPNSIHNVIQASRGISHRPTHIPQ